MESQTTQDLFLGGRIELHQPTNGYRAGIDPVFLAAAIDPKRGKNILDVGTGVGAVSLALAKRCPDVRITGLELQEDLVKLARQNVSHNNMDDRVTVLQGDVLSMSSNLPIESFDQVITNPPYYDADKFKHPTHTSKAASNVESHVSLESWLKYCVSMLKPKGIFTMIHRAEKSCEASGILKEMLGNMSVYPLWPTEEKAALRVIIQGKKGVKGNTRLLPGLVLHRGEDKYSPEAEEILRHAGALNLS